MWGARRPPCDTWGCESAGNAQHAPCRLGVRWGRSPRSYPAPRQTRAPRRAQTSRAESMTRGCAESRVLPRASCSCTLSGRKPLKAATRTSGRASGQPHHDWELETKLAEGPLPLLLRRAGGLPAKLVAGKCNQVEPLVSVLVVQRPQTRIVHLQAGRRACKCMQWGAAKMPLYIRQPPMQQQQQNSMWRRESGGQMHLHSEGVIRWRH
jgi:hypothetical protein